ncbi:MAG: hypothetical protein ACOC53_04450 [Candidatus Saliniplasma sp.]
MEDENSFTSKILDFMEKDRFNLTSAIIYVFIIGGVRSVMEAHVGRYYGYSRYLFTQHVLLSYPQLLVGTLVVYLIIKRHPKKIMNVFLLGYGLLLIPPIADYFLYRDFGAELGTQYEYLEVHEIIPALLNSWNPFYIYTLGSKGQGLMFLSLMIGTASYVAMKTRFNQKILRFFKDRAEKMGVLKSGIKVVCAYFGIFLWMWMIGSFKFIFSQESDHYLLFNHFKVPYYSKYYIFFRNYNYPDELIFPSADSGIWGLPTNLITNQNRLILCAFFIILALISTLIILYLSQRKRLVLTLKNLPWIKVFLGSLAGFVGVASVHMLDPDFTKGFAIDPTYFLHTPYIFFSILIIILLILFSFFLTRLSRYGLEEKESKLSRLDDHFSKYHYTHLTASIGLTVLFLSVIIGYITFTISIIWVLLYIFLTSKKKNIFRENLKFAIFGILAFFTGFYMPNAWRTHIIDFRDTVEVTREVVYRYPPITLYILLIVLWIAVSFWIMAKILDLDSDKVNIFPSFEEKTNIYSTIGLTFLLLLFPLIYFTSFTGLLIFIGPAIATPIWYKIMEKGHVISVGYILQLILFSLSFMYL